MIVSGQELADTLRAIVREELWEAVASRADDGWLDQQAAAEYLGMKLDALKSATTRGQVPVHRGATGRRRYRKSELDVFATANDRP